MIAPLELAKYRSYSVNLLSLQEEKQIAGTKTNGDMLGALQSSIIKITPERRWGNCWTGNGIDVEMELEIKTEQHLLKESLCT